ncbi:MAG: protein translocase subunit SecF [bacterium]|nr:protein translocase subunit SecF [bacterium]
MQFLTDSHIDFMKYRKVFIWVSILLLVIACAELFFLTGLNLGIDFAGGTQLTLRLRDDGDVDLLRRTLENAGLREAQIQRYGEEERREFLIKTPVVEDSEEGSSEALTAALESDLNSDAAGRFDLNQRGADALATLLYEADPDDRVLSDEIEARDHYAGVAQAVLDQRHSLAIFGSWDQLAGVPGLSEESLTALKEKAFFGAYNVLSNENVGPQIGSELRTKGVLAVVMSLGVMLLYIWFRFELRFGIGALVAVFHDFLITLGLYALLNYEFNLPTIAAFLTLVGYSVNDTVVIFDRVRENMRRSRSKPLIEVMNHSLNQTLSRTILTSGTTLLVVACLFFFGGEVIRGFAFVLLIGVIIGTYSSIFVASPFALMWEKYFGRDAKMKRRS